MLNIIIDPSNERKIADFRTLGMKDIKNLGLRFLLDLLPSAREHHQLITPTMRHIQQLIEERVFEISPQLAELAELSGLSLSRFKERFKHEVGVGPGNYIIHRKIEKA